MTDSEKAIEVIREIVRWCNEHEGEKLAFERDWGGNSITIWYGKYHVHVGDPEIGDEQLIDRLHAEIVCGRGVSPA